MKILLIAMVSMVSMVNWGQSNRKEIDTVIFEGNQKTIKYTDGSQEIVLSLKKVPAKTIQSKRNFKTLQGEVDYYNHYISQLQTKIQHLKNNPEEDKMAREKGWYDQMNKYIAESKARIKELEELIKQKNQ